MECREMVEAYVKWLRSGLSVETIQGGVCEITTPFLDRHNDHLQIYISNKSDKLSISDDGYIISDLISSGMEFSSPKRKSILSIALNGFGVKKKNNELIVEASKKNFGQRTHSLLQAMISINDMFVLAQPRVASIFLEDVGAFLKESGVRFSPRVKLTGKTGYDHAIDFLIPASEKCPERLVQAINSPNKGTIGSYLFTLNDTRDARSESSKAYAILNDNNMVIPSDVFDALKAYNVEAAPWSKRTKYKDFLAA